MGDTIRLMKAEFMVEGKEDYYVCLEFKRVRKTVVEVVTKIFESFSKRLAEIVTATPDDNTVKYVKLNLQITGQKPMKLKWNNVPLKAVFALEYALVEAQKLMLDETSKL